MGEKMNDINITQSFYNSMASQYDKLFLDWETTTHEQAAFLSRIFRENGFDYTSQILDCACGIGTQAIGLALLGYNVCCQYQRLRYAIERKANVFSTLYT